MSVVRPVRAALPGYGGWYYSGMLQPVTPIGMPRLKGMLAGMLASFGMTVGILASFGMTEASLRRSA